MGWREFQAECMASLTQSIAGGRRVRRWPASVVAIGIAACIVIGLAFAPVQGASAADMRSVSERAAVLYDAPSTRAKKLYVVAQYYPLEVVVNIDSWFKVRDVSGDLSWVEKKSLSDRRTLIVSVALADIRQSADEKSPLAFQAREGVVLELVEAPAAGWVKVRHRDGQAGYIAARQVWGL